MARLINAKHMLIGNDFLTAGRDAAGQTWIGFSPQMGKVDPRALIWFGNWIALIGIAALGNRDDWPCADLPVFADDSDTPSPADKGEQDTAS